MTAGDNLTTEPQAAGDLSGAPSAHVVIVTGRSGAGRSTALNTLEDCGYMRIETPVLDFVPEMLRQLVERGERAIAVSVDPRAAGRHASAVLALIEQLRTLEGVRPLVLFVDASDEALRRRYTETRRRHPLAPDQSVELGVRRDKELTEPVREVADLIIDSTHLQPSDFKRIVSQKVAGTGAEGLSVSVVSFAYRNGLPDEADLVFDCRFLRNPHYEPSLRAQTGRSRDVAEYVAADPLYEPYLTQLADHARLLLPAFAAEGKSYVTFAFGCTGGKHRSIAVAEAFASVLKAQGWRPMVRHREHPAAEPSAPGSAAADMNSPACAQTDARP